MAARGEAHLDEGVRVNLAQVVRLDGVLLGGEGLVLAELTVAAERECVTLDGIGMLVNQGAEAFRRWTGVEPDRGVLRSALEAATSGP